MTQSALRERLDEPIARATAITKRTLAWFPVRVWRHFLQHNGFLLAAGVSYQALFAVFAAIYVAFAIAGLWLGGSEEAINALIAAINSYIPNLILPEGEGGLFTTEQVAAIATQSAGVLAITGAIAIIVAAWTAIGFVTFARRAVRDIFGLRPDLRNYIVLKARDLVAALVFGVALIAGSAMSAAGTWALELVFGLFGWDTRSGWFGFGVRIASVVVSFALYTFALGALVRYLTGTSLRWRSIWGGAMLGGAALTLLQLAAGILLFYTPSNPLLATFAVFIGLLLWFRVVGIIILVAAAWIAVGAKDGDLPLVELTKAERVAAEHQALLLAAKVRLRTAHEARETAPWYRVWVADRAVREAVEELHAVEAVAPPPQVKRETLLE
nr:MULTISPECIES: YihY/virulence factor BrkB family protein [Microbacterium]